MVFRIDKARSLNWSDLMAVLLAIALPWSTSATAILAVLWLIAVIPLLSFDSLRRECLIWAGGLPVALFLLGVAGMFWADVSWIEKFHGLDSFFKLLLIPLFIIHFRQSSRGHTVLLAYLASCTALLLVGVAGALWPSVIFSRSPDRGVAVHTAATQSGEFTACIAVLLWLIVDFVERRAFAMAAAATILSLCFLADIGFVATGRTALATIPVLLVVLALRRLSVVGVVSLLTGVATMASVIWVSSPYLRHRVDDVGRDLRSYETSTVRTSVGERLEFWRKSLIFVREAPVNGHGTGSIPKLYRDAAEGTGLTAVATTNPHNQTFAVAIQLGAIGVAVLWAMWVSHLVLFRKTTLAAWIGLVVVIQNIVGSIFNSHLFDFVQGWTYVIGVGVAGGMVYRAATSKNMTLGHVTADHQS
jgi:hypothetical protein